MISGRATPEGTASYAQKRASLHADHWRNVLELTLSSIGIGTYLGNPDDADDAKYSAAVQRAVELGVNIIDTASNYRYQRSERAIGAGLKKAIDAGLVAREEIFVCSKAGFLAGDSAWVENAIIKPGVASWEDIVADCHCMTPAYLKHQVEQSRTNLGLETIDVYYVHNPETQMPETGPDEFYRRLTEAFRALEECVAEGKIQVYGTATWEAFRVPSTARSFVSLEQVARCAIEAGGPEHHFRMVQLPFNIGMPEACKETVQPWGEESATALQVAYETGAAVVTSVPLLQGRLLGRLALLKEKFPGLTTDAQRCLQFARSTPGIVAPLCGMKDVRHVEENFGVASVPALSEEEFNSFFEQ